MAAPLRFFCNHCTQMIKIGNRMAGRVVVCPQCGTRLSVPLRSDPTAEAVYAAQRKQREVEKTLGIPSRRSVTGILPGIFSRQSKKKPDESEIGDVDRWIDDFWKTPVEPPEFPHPTVHGHHQDYAELLGVPTPPRPPGDGMFPREIPEHMISAPIRPASSRADGDFVDFRRPPTSAPASYHALNSIWRHGWLRSLLLTFLNVSVGFILGVAVHSELQKTRPVSQRAGNGQAFASPARLKETRDRENDPAANAIIALRGKLLYTLPEGEVKPDTDSVALFLPLDRPPTVPFGSTGLGVGQETYKTREGTLLIEETGGAYVRTDVDGNFDVLLSGPGKYVVLYLSAHVKRDRQNKIDAETLAKLRRYFSSPETLIGSARYFCREESLSSLTKPLVYRFE